MAVFQRHSEYPRSPNHAGIFRRDAILSLLSLMASCQAPTAIPEPSLPPDLADIVAPLISNDQVSTFQGTEVEGGVRAISMRGLTSKLREGQKIAAVDICEIAGFEYSPATGLHILGRNVPGRPRLWVNDIAAAIKSIDHAVGVTLIPRNVSDETAQHDAITFPSNLAGSPIIAVLLANDYRLKQHIAESLSARLADLMRSCSLPAETPAESRIMYIPGEHRKRIDHIGSVARCIFEAVPMLVVPESDLRPNVIADPFLSDVARQFTAEIPALVQTDALLSMQDNFVRLSLMGGIISAREDIRLELSFWDERYELPQLPIPATLPGIHAITVGSTCYGRRAGAQNEMSGIAKQRSVYGGVLIDHTPWLNGGTRSLYSLGSIWDQVGASIIQRTRLAPQSRLDVPSTPQIGAPSRIINPQISSPPAAVPNVSVPPPPLGGGGR
jgi:hypothetical protein